MKSTIHVTNLSKLYHLGDPHHRHDTLRDTLADIPHKIHSRSKKRESQNTLWALNNVSFEVLTGEVFGVVGRNGAGKSTLLKILARITEPTSGRVIITGRVGSLLEVGTGFHPELTGRENIFLNGAILGMRKIEISRKFDEIVAFSEIEKFLDTPVKRYSSGMYVRLAFAVAAHLEPEVLLVDEVLAVGDTAFQRKCLGKMGEISSEGRTILFVSHNLIALRKLCQKAVFLDNGCVVALGDANQVVEDYLQTTLKEIPRLEIKWENPDEAPADESIRINRIGVCPISQDMNKMIHIDDGFTISLDFECLEILNEWAIIFRVISSEDIIAFSSSTKQDTKLASMKLTKGKFRLRLKVPANLLNSGYYSIQIVFRKPPKEPLKLGKAIQFEIIDSGAGRTTFFGKRDGIIAMVFPWELENQHNAAN